MDLRKIVAAALLGAAAAAVTACTTGLSPESSLGQTGSLAAGQTFYVVPASGTKRSAEFDRYAIQVARRLEARGYRPAAAPEAADLVVSLGYSVSHDLAEHRKPWRPSRYPRSPGTTGHYVEDGPFASAYSPTTALSNPYRAYTVYEIRLNVKIIRRKDKTALFEGRAQLRSDDDKVGPAVPRLLQTVFADRSSTLR